MDDIKNVFGKLTKTITKTSGELVKSTKLSLGLANEEEKLKNMYIELGKKVHEIYAYGGSLGKFFDEKYIELLTQEKKINEIKKELDSVKGTRSCLDCGHSISINATFCPACGRKVEETVESYKEVKNINLEKEIEIENKQEEVVPEAEFKICEICGKKNSVSDKFCLACGRKI